MTTIARNLMTGAVAVLLASCATSESDVSLFKQTDTNKDGVLSLDEVNKTCLPRLFNRFDVDGNGSVTLAEVRTVAPKFDEKLFAERDLDRDGKVTLAENEKVALSKGGLKQYFAEVDADGDGMIVKAEAEAFAAKRNSSPR